MALQMAAATPRVYDGRARQLEVEAPRLGGEVRVDGVLDEPQWARAAVLTGFSQYLPSDGRPSEDSTEVLVWYSASAIYFGVRAVERHGGRGAVHATVANRDKLEGEDQIQLYLDTFHDGLHAAVFAVNPLGVQADGVRSGTDINSPPQA